MSESKFTPLPWIAVQHGEGIYTWTIRGNDEMEDRTLAIVGVGTPNLKRDEANMHLISSAPEMYEALEEILTDLDTFPQVAPGVDHPEVFDLKQKIRKLLRKARGESEVEK